MVESLVRHPSNLNGLKSLFEANSLANNSVVVKERKELSIGDFIKLKGIYAFWEIILKITQVVDVQKVPLLAK